MKTCTNAMALFHKQNLVSRIVTVVLEYLRLV